MLIPNVATTNHQALDEMHELLRTCCQDSCPPRNVAIRYQTCRTTLLTGELGPHVPGFLTQCPSSMKFREFIQLYDRDAQRRMTFVDRSLADCWSQLKSRPAHERPPDDKGSNRFVNGTSHLHRYAPQSSALQLAGGSDDFMDEAGPGDDGFFWAQAAQSASRR